MRYPLPAAAWDKACIPRMGLAHLTRLAFDRVDLDPVWRDLLARLTDDPPGAGVGMDLSVIAQLRGDKATGLAIQKDALALHQIFATGAPPGPSSLRVLALATASDIGANMPIEFLVEGQDISVATLYMGPGVPLPACIPAHDVAVVVSHPSPDGEQILAAMENWPVPVLNHPARIRNLERDRLWLTLAGIPGLFIPPTRRVSRDALLAGEAEIFPLIIRPLESHAGFGLARLDEISEFGAYLAGRAEDHFFVSPFIDYADGDGLFRKYRIAIVAGKPYPVHMAIAEEWKVWYLNAEMAHSVANRVAEACFLQFFEDDFGRRHARAFDRLAERIGLDYVVVDCAETKKGELLIFEADHCSIVHDMDPVSVYPYKPMHMQRLFKAFGAMLRQRAPGIPSRAA